MNKLLLSFLFVLTSHASVDFGEELDFMVDHGGQPVMAMTYTKTSFYFHVRTGFTCLPHDCPQKDFKKVKWSLYSKELNSFITQWHRIDPINLAGFVAIEVKNESSIKKLYKNISETHLVIQSEGKALYYFPFKTICENYPSLVKDLDNFNAEACKPILKF